MYSSFELDLALGWLGQNSTEIAATLHPKAIRSSHCHKKKLISYTNVLNIKESVLKLSILQGELTDLSLARLIRSVFAN